MPKLKESIDVSSWKYKISSLKVVINNANYGGNVTEEIFKHRPLINQFVTLYFKSNTCNKFRHEGQDILQEDDVMPKVFRGVITDIKISSDKINIVVEDISEKA